VCRRRKPLSLGVIRPPVITERISYAAISNWGSHMHYGGGHGGIIASNDDPKFVMGIPFRLFGIASTIVAGEYGFGDVDTTDPPCTSRGRQGMCRPAAALWASLPESTWH